MLNKEQTQVANFKEGVALVVAVAGSGKTKTMISRTINLIEQGVKPEHIWLTTFTNKAAKEIKDRLTTENPLAVQVQVGTFHSFCLKIFRQYLSHAQDNTVIDQDDVEQAIKMILDQHEHSFPNLSSLKARSIYEVLSFATNTCESIENTLQKKRPQLLEACQEFEKMKSLLEEFKSSQGLLDFDDILVKVIEFLRTKSGDSVKERCHYLIVDEFQDTNKLQFELIDLLSEKHRNLMCVGDDAQSIYAFRGANPKQLEEFMDKYKELQVFKLEKNYRSKQGILDVGNHVLNAMNSKIKKQLISANMFEDKSGATFYDVESEAQQVEFIIDEIKKAADYKDICILIKYGYHGALLEVKLLANKIPYVKYGGLKFLEKRHIKDVISFLKLKVNPKDPLAAFRCFGLMPGVGAKSAKLMFDNLNEIENTQNWGKCLSKVKDKSNSIYKLLEVDFASGAPRQSLEALLTNIVLAYTPYLVKNAENKEKLQSQEMDLKELIKVAAEYKSINEFVSDVILGESGIDPKESGNSVLISTIHSIKGLERNHVLIPNAYEGVYPKEGVDEESLEEEKRLFYVAVTRAKYKLSFIKPFFNNKRERTYKSRFIPRSVKSVNI